MDEKCQRLLHKAACGHLVQGLVHNMSGPLQILSMQMELMKTALRKIKPEVDENCQKILDQQETKIEQINEQIERLRDILNAINEVTEENPTSLDLNHLLKQAVIFWEGDLRFKHQVPKEFSFAPGPLLFFAPPGVIQQGFCALFWWMVPPMVENQDRLFITTEKTDRGPRAIIGVEKVLPQEDEFFHLGHELLSPFAEIKKNQKTLSLLFSKIKNK